MTQEQIGFCWATVLCLLTVAGWRAVQEQLPGGRRSRLVLAGSGPPVYGPGPQAERRVWARLPGLLAPELLALPAGLAFGRATDSPVPVLAAALAVLPLRRWRLRRRLAAEAGQRAAAVVELCAALAGELRSGATPEQALHLVTARLAADPEGLRRLGAEPVARLAAGRYGGDVPAALLLLAELPGGSGAAAIAACWRVASDGGSGLAAALDRVAEALRGERELAEEIAGELAGPRTAGRGPAPGQWARGTPAGGPAAHLVRTGLPCGGRGSGGSGGALDGPHRPGGGPGRAGSPAGR